MKLVRIRNKVGFEELSDPSVDVIALVCSVLGMSRISYRESIRVIGDLWYWNDQFWLQAVDKLGVTYYQKKLYAIYPVSVDNCDTLLANLKI